MGRLYKMMTFCINFNLISRKTVANFLTKIFCDALLLVQIGFFLPCFHLKIKGSVWRAGGVLRHRAHRPQTWIILRERKIYITS